MSTPAESIAALSTTLQAWAEDRVSDSKARVEAFRAAGIAARDLGKIAGALHAEAMRDMVAELGPTATAKELGISRNRVYEVMKHEG